MLDFRMQFAAVSEWAGLLGLLLLMMDAVIDCQSSEDAGQSSDDVEWEEEEPEVPEYEVPQGVQSIDFKMFKDLRNEDENSPHMPRDVLCDGCRIIAYVITKKLQKIQTRYKKGHRFSESDVVDLLDGVCKDNEKMFDGYGLKEISGVRRLAGEGLETKDVPGVMKGGGKWPSRLRDLCEEYVGEVDEVVIYDHFIRQQSLENLLCRNKQLTNKCPPRRKKKKMKTYETARQEL